MKSILILGAGIMQLPAIKLARREGWRVYAADGDTHAPGRSLVDRFLPVDLKDREGMAAAAEELRKREGLDGVFTAGTDFSFTAAYVTEKLGLPGIPPEAALRASNKGLMRRAFRDAGVPIPEFREFRAGEDPLSALGKLAFPLVIKPVDNMGSRGIRRADTPEQLLRGFRRAAGYSPSGAVIVEEFIDGPEFSLDALVEEGKITICGVADRHIFYPPYFIEMGHTMPTNQPEEVVQAVEEVFLRGIKALGITRGAAKGDLKLSPRGPVVGEIAARLSGGFMSGWTYPCSSGVEVTLGGLRLAVGLPAGDLRPRRKHFSAERAFISLPGRVEEVIGYGEALDSEGISFGYLKVTPGDRVDFPRNNVEKCGNFISQAPDRDKAISVAAAAAAKPFLRLKPGEEATAAFIARRSHPWVPDAYTPAVEENLAYLEKLPPRPVEPLRFIPLLPRGGDETCRDWQGRSLEYGLQEVSRFSGLPLLPGRLGPEEKPFWDAFLRGGIQGAVWYIDTLRSEAPRR